MKHTLPSLTPSPFCPILVLAKTFSNLPGSKCPPYAPPPGTGKIHTAGSILPNLSLSAICLEGPAEVSWMPLFRLCQGSHTKQLGLPEWHFASERGPSLIIHGRREERHAGHQGCAGSEINVRRGNEHPQGQSHSPSEVTTCLSWSLGDGVPGQCESRATPQSAWNVASPYSY